jgi:hypothetical protein
MPLVEHWKVYLPVMLLSFVLMLPAVMGAQDPRCLKRWFVASVALLLAVQWRCHGSRRAMAYYFVLLLFLCHLIYSSDATLSGIAHRAAAA